MAADQANASAIVVAGEGWPAALCGLVASKLVDDHYRPVIAVGKDEHGKYVGSGRSIPGFDVTGALRACAEHIVKFGGHPAACGLTIQGEEKFEAFKSAFVAHADDVLKDADLTPSLDIEEEIAVHEVTRGLVEEMRKLEPYGEGNPRPRFLLRDARVATSRLVGAEGKHLQMTVASEHGGRLKLIGFGFGDRADACVPGRPVQAVIELDLNEWNGRVEPQGRIIDLKTES